MGRLCAALNESSEVGDAILTSTGSALSSGIKLAGASQHSHIGVVTAPGWITESNTWSMTPDESSEGLYETEITELARRKKLTTVTVLRPIGLDPRRLADQASTLRTSSPGFPSVGMAFLALSWFARPLVRGLPKKYSDAIVAYQVRLISDGQAVMSCAEAVARLYLAAGLALRFRSLTFERLARTASPSLSMQPAKPDTLHTRTAATGSWPGSGRGFIGALANVRFVVKMVRLAAGRRSSTVAYQDAADFLTPGDFLRAEPFTHIATFEQDEHGWVKVM